MEDMHFRLSEELRTRLERIAEQAGATFSSIIREGTRREIERLEEFYDE